MTGAGRLGALCCAVALGAACREAGPARERTPAPGGALGARAAGTVDTREPGMEVVARDFAFDAPERVASGTVTLRFVNRGAAAHEATVVTVNGDVALEAFLSAIRAGEPLPPSVRAVGGTPRTSAGGRSSVRLALPPGDYLIACLVRDEDGTSHVARGMLRPLTVAPLTLPR